MTLPKDFAWGCVYEHHHVGSRVTCDPVPTDTDDDWLFFIDSRAFEDQLIRLGFETTYNENYDLTGNPSPFKSWRRGKLNILTTWDAEFTRRFMAATAVCTRLNLLDKADRIALFQAVLYGNTSVPNLRP